MEEVKVVSKKDIQTRLRRIEGQIKGIEKMVEGDVCCKDVLIQVAAVRAAINKVGALVLENYAKTCLICGDGEKTPEEKIEELVSTLTMFLK
ncbi:metal-sensitive transcriptional regulator [Clostridium sp. CX1]|uniref:Metal-sensitive transcriptional regulator n=1 Tax=Clostridium tanneri TaxID=3037988 RepID=A0ABU4JNI1_9CLOT|nr:MULTISPECIES: metal-sensitive transcriptional regulator [unclassified Clostridium]MCT8975984.1 metal-sensitive transcriptional regulator [Clostridium sp. CX1]MDW8799536.1 metal-sensitive transcriptional regulator [Clostridium sp. A1-XYC3]